MKKYFLIGEIHGTKESPKAFLDIVKKKKIKNIALEFESNNQKEIDEYLSGKRKLNDLSIFKKKGKDGRDSDAVKNLIKKLKSLSLKIYFIDDWKNKGNERDKLMARNLKKINKKIAFYCGNIHAMKKPFKIGKKSMKTCGSYLPSKKTISYNILPIEGGKHYNFGIKKINKDEELCKKYKKEKLPKIIKSKTKEYDYLYLIKKASYSN